MDKTKNTPERFEPLNWSVQRMTTHGSDPVWQPDIFRQLMDELGVNPVRLSDRLEKAGIGSVRNWRKGGRPRSDHQAAIAGLFAELLNDPENKSVRIVWMRLNTPR